MAIRLREVAVGSGVRLFAVCAAETDPKPGDRYLDDGDHIALQEKFVRDWRKSGLIPGGPLPTVDPVLEAERVRDEDVEMARWCAETDVLVAEVVALLPPDLERRFRERFGR